MNCRQALAEHERLLRTIVFARVREAEAVDEVMQEVALAAVRASAPPADGAKVGPSLYRVRQALLYRRKWGRMRTSETDYMPRASSQSDITWARLSTGLGYTAPVNRQSVEMSQVERAGSPANRRRASWCF